MSDQLTAIKSLVLEVADPATAEDFYAAFGVGAHVGVRTSEEPTSGFRGFTVSLIVAQPNVVDAYLDAALGAGATSLKPARKSFWGYGGVVQAPDGAIWKVATSSKKNAGPATKEFAELAVLLGVEDVKATRQFYVDRGLAVAKSFGSKYVEFEGAGSQLKLALYGRRALAKDAGVPVEGSGSHRIAIRSDAGTFTDPDGFAWESM
jgi:uncharacterized glyoxalase superfamily protein PhnB